jgi:F-type H+-transporting ATPase subunit epsilon
MAIKLIVVTPEGEAISCLVESVVLPGAEGDFGVLEHHARFLAPLKPGPVEIKLPDGSTEWAAVSGGFAEVSGHQVVVLVDECFKGSEIDLEHAMRTREEADDAIEAFKTRERALEEAEDNEMEHLARLEDSRVRATVQIDVYSRHHG